MLLALLLALAFCAAFAAGWGLPALGALGAVSTAGLLIAAMTALFVRTGLFFPAAAPVLVLALLLGAPFVARFVVHQRRARQWRLQLENARQVTIESMAAVAETRDPETGAHIKRTQHYVRAIAEQLRRSGHYTQTLTPDYIRPAFPFRARCTTSARSGCRTTSSSSRVRSRRASR